MGVLNYLELVKAMPMLDECVRVLPRCSRCGGNIIRSHGEDFCLLCGKPFTISDKRRYWGSLGGLKTFLTYGKAQMSYMGKRGVGALEFRPARGSHTESAKPIEMKSLVEAARTVLKGDFSDDTHAQPPLRI